MLMFLTLLIPIFLAAAPGHSGDLSSAVVKVYATVVPPDFARPWRKGAARSVSGTGVILEGGRILTAAHIVSDAAYIQVRKNGDSRKYTARVRWIDHEADLALMTVGEERFFDGTFAAKLGTLPRRRGRVTLYGYPVGGKEISTTRGIVSRIEERFYLHGYMDNLTLQIDAPINPGNSGGPAFDEEGRIVGIAMQSYSGRNGIGYLIPAEVIRHFLDDIRDGRCDGFPDDGLSIQPMENRTLREFYGLKEREGVLVVGVRRHSSADGYLRPGDVILTIDGIDVAGDNSVRLDGYGRISSNYLVRRHQVGERLRLKILRGGKEREVAFPLRKRVSIAPYLHEKKPRYFLFGGMVFMPLTINLFKTYGSDWVHKAPAEWIHLFTSQSRVARKIDEAVVLNNLLPNDENAGYNFIGEVVAEVNGVTIGSFKKFVRQIERSDAKYIDILFRSGYRVVLDRKRARESDPETMRKYGIELPRSHR